jgi:hypothetical protein
MTFFDPGMIKTSCLHVCSPKLVNLLDIVHLLLHLNCCIRPARLAWAPPTISMQPHTSLLLANAAAGCFHVLLGLLLTLGLVLVKLGG